MSVNASVPVPIEVAVLDSIQKEQFKVLLDDGTQIAPGDLQKYRITLNGNVVDFKFVKWNQFQYFVPFDQYDFEKYDIQIFNLQNLRANIDKCAVQLNDGRKYHIKQFIINIDLLNKNATKTFVPTITSSGKIVTKSNAVKPIPLQEEEEERGRRSKERKVDTGTENKARETSIEMSEDLSKVKVNDLIWYLKQKSNNRKLDEVRTKDFEAQLESYDTNFLYESIFLNPSNYSSSAIAILLCLAPFFYTYPRFYKASSVHIIIGVIGILMCMNIIQSKYGVLLKSKQLANIYIGCVILFFLVFFILLNKLNHLVLFFLSGAIVFMAMNYILRILISDPKRGFGMKRLAYNTNNITFTPFNPRIEKICDEVRRRYSLNMGSKELYMYFTSYELDEKSKSFTTTEFVCNIVQPILGVIVLYLMGGILNKAKNYTLLKSDAQLLEESLLKAQNPNLVFEESKYAYYTSPLLGFTEESVKVFTNQYNYFLPKELNVHYVMEAIMDEVKDKIIKPKSAHLYEKNMLNEKVVKNLDKHMRRFLRFIEDEYLPVAIMEENGIDMKIQTLRKDNRYNLFDGTYNKVHDVLDRKELIEINMSDIEAYYAEYGLNENEMKKMRDVCKDYIYLKLQDPQTFMKRLNESFYDFMCMKAFGKKEYDRLKNTLQTYQVEMEAYMKNIQEAQQKISEIQSTLKLLTESDNRRTTYTTQYENAVANYQEIFKTYESIKGEHTAIQSRFDGVRAQYEPAIQKTEDQLKSYIQNLRVHLKPNLFITLIQYIEENNQTVDLDARNSALDSVKYKFKDIYDFITNEELFDENEQTTLIHIIEDKVRNLFNAIYERSIPYDRNNILLGNITPESIKQFGNRILTYILQPMASWILLGKIMGSAWYGGKMATSDIQKNYTEIARNFEYGGHFHSIWNICSMGIDRYYHENKMNEHREHLVKKIEDMNAMTRILHYVGSALFFILFMVLLNAYNNMVFGMGMYPLWTNLPGVIVLLLLLIIIYFMRK